MKNKVFRCSILFALSLILAGTPVKALAYQWDRTLEIHNHASRPIWHLYISNIDEERWGDDQLGREETIPPNRYRTFDVDDGTGHCHFDFKAVLSDGSTAIRRNMNVCAERTWTIID